VLQGGIIFCLLHEKVLQGRIIFSKMLSEHAHLLGRWDFMNWLWWIKICKLDLVWRWFWNTEIGNFWVPQAYKNIFPWSTGDFWVKILP
jgi:hypothetical protein